MQAIQFRVPLVLPRSRSCLPGFGSLLVSVCLVWSQLRRVVHGGTDADMYVMGQGHEHLGPGTSMVQFVRGGLGCASCSGKCGSCGGMGLFDSGMDVSGWGAVEWIVAGIGAYAVISTVFTTGRVARKVRAIPGERRKRKAARLRARAAELSKR
jgi:hypothetical protein